jgi:HEPN domain-containing protein
MSREAEQARIARRWVLKAEHDLTMAERGMTGSGDDPLDMVCFHAQQCAEKYLKAVLVARGLDYPRSHDMTLILASVTVHVLVGIVPRDVAVLNRYATGTRYPEPSIEVDRGDAEKALEIARRIRDAALAELPAAAKAD